MSVAATAPAPRVARRIDRLGGLLTACGALALATQPFLMFKANRIVSGTPRDIVAALSGQGAVALLSLLAAVAAVAVLTADPRLRLAVFGAGLLGLLLAVAAGADHLAPSGNRLARIAPGGAAWVLLACLALLAADALARLRPGPLGRVLALAVTLTGFALLLRLGVFDALSIMREYAVRADQFAHAARTHVLLSAGALAGAVSVGLPLGILCHRVAGLRGPVLQTLNLIQTIPSIALFGMLMVPLGLLAGAVPLLGEWGVHGIGAAPAVVALFLYALLPVVANTVVGLGQVAPDTVEAARGMGLTGRQLLLGVELPLAFPVILTGIRIVMVQTIGLVTVAALIGGGGFGTFVFQGIGQTAIDLVLLGAVPTVALAFTAAVLLDALVEVTRRGAR